MLYFHPLKETNKNNISFSFTEKNAKYIQEYRVISFDEMVHVSQYWFIKCGVFQKNENPIVNTRERRQSFCLQGIVGQFCSYGSKNKAATTRL